MNLKSLAAHVVAYAGAMLVILNVVSSIAPSVNLPASAQAWIAAATAVVTVIIEVAKQVGGQAIANRKAKHA